MRIAGASFLTFCGLALVACNMATPAFAESLEEIRARCKETVGRPIVQACAGVGRNRDPALIEQCKAKASPQVRACVTAAAAKFGGKAAAAPVLDEDKVTSAMTDAGPAAFVAPPRTISDITAILDNEKPDPAKIKALHDAADAAAPNGKSKGDLINFYYERGNARALLGRTADALSDGQKALELGQGSRTP